jgi:hypothetical protein
MKKQGRVSRQAKFLCALIISVICFRGFSVPVDLIQNGSFAAGLTDWTLSGHQGYGMAFDGGADGGAYLFLDSLGFSPLSQDVAATPGQRYLLTFAFRGSYPAQQSPPFAINVLWNGDLLGSYSLNIYSASWVTESLFLTGGPGSMDDLTFVNPDPSFAALDAVSLVSVPDSTGPAIYFCSAAALIGFSALQRRRKIRNPLPSPTSAAGAK